MAYTTSDQVIDDVVAVADRLAALAAVDLRANVTDAVVENLRTEMAGVADNIRAITADLDVLDAEADLLIVDEGAASIAVILWQLGTRVQLTQLAGRARAVLDVGQDVRKGQPTKIAIVRDGDTWERIAAREAGDWRRWQAIRAANPTVPFTGLTTGTYLVIPDGGG